MIARNQIKTKNQKSAISKCQIF